MFSIKVKHNLLLLKILIKQLETIDDGYQFEMDKVSTSKINKFITNFKNVNENDEMRSFLKKDTFYHNSKVYGNLNLTSEYNELYEPFSFELELLNDNLSDEKAYEEFDKLLIYLKKIYSEFVETQVYELTFHKHGQFPEIYIYYFNGEGDFTKFVRKSGGCVDNKIFSEEVTTLLLNNVKANDAYEFAIKNFDPNADVLRYYYYKDYKRTLTNAVNTLLSYFKFEAKLNIKKYLLREDKYTESFIIEDESMLTSLYLDKPFEVTYDFVVYDTETTCSYVSNNIENEIISNKADNFFNDVMKNNLVKSAFENKQKSLNFSFIDVNTSISYLVYFTNFDFDDETSTASVKIKDLDSDVIKVLSTLETVSNNDENIILVNSIFDSLITINNNFTIYKMVNLHRYLLDNKSLLLKLC